MKTATQITMRVATFIKVILCCLPLIEGTANETVCEDRFLANLQLFIGEYIVHFNYKKVVFYANWNVKGRCIIWRWMIEKSVGTHLQAICPYTLSVVFFPDLLVNYAYCTMNITMICFRLPLQMGSFPTHFHLHLRTRCPEIRQDITQSSSNHRRVRTSRWALSCSLWWNVDLERGEKSRENNWIRQNIGYITVYPYLVYFISYVWCSFRHTRLSIGDVLFNYTFLIGSFAHFSACVH